MVARQSRLSRFLSRGATLGALFGHFTSPGRVFLLPVVFFLIASAVLLVVAGGLSYVAPFVYAIF